MTIARVLNFGCKTNQYEGEELERALAAIGVRVDDEAAPDVAIVNSCTVTEKADRRARQAVMRIAREHPRARIYVTGCYAAGDRAELAALPHVAAVCFDKRELAELIARELHVAHPLAPTKERPSGEAASSGVAHPPPGVIAVGAVARKRPHARASEPHHPPLHAKPAQAEYRRDLPHLQSSAKSLFVTFCTQDKWTLPESVRGLVVAHCLHDHGTKYFMHGVVVMPDHVHMVLTPTEDSTGHVFGLAEIMNGIKGASSHSINRELGRGGSVWQKESFDHVLRSDENLRQKVEYVCLNPVRKGLVKDQNEYPWLWREWVEGQTDVAGVAYVAHPPSGEAASAVSPQAGAPVLHKHQQQSHPGAGVPHQPHKPSRQARHGRAYLKIQDGCDAFCSYCIVPLVRPTLRSQPIDAILREAREIVRAGFLEIVLTGIHLGRYGSSLVGGHPRVAPLAVTQQKEGGHMGPPLQEVVRRVAATPGLARVRLSSLEMPEVSDGLIELIATNPVVCPHLHLPLQSGDAGVLSAMNRRYTPSEFLATVRRIRERVPEIAITTDVIVGFPGESDDAFLNTLRVVGEAAFSKVHVFPFSARPGTKAATLPKRIPQRVVTRRKKGLIALADTLALRYKRRFIGRVVDVIVETVETDLSTGQTFAVGLTPHYLRVRFEGTADLIDRRVSVRIDRATPELMTGRTCPEAFRGIEPTPAK